MMRNLFISICLLISLTSCLYPSCDDIVGTYYNIDEGETVIHYVDIKEDGTYMQYYKNDTLERRHESTWRWIDDSPCTIELWEWNVYKTSEIDDFFGEQLGSKRANILFFVNEEDLRISRSSDRSFIKTEYVEKVKQYRESEEAYWVNKDTLYYDSGAVKEIGKLDGGDKYGDWQFFYETGELESEGIMVYNDPTFLWKYYYKNGNLKKLGVYENSGANPKIGTWEYYHENGQLREKGIYIYIGRKQIKSDDWELYDSTGKLIEIKKYRPRERYYDSLLKTPPFNYAKGEIIKKRNEWIKDEDKYYLEYKASLKDTLH